MQTNPQYIQNPIVQQPTITAFPEPLRIAVVDDSPEFLAVICGLLRMEEGFQVVGTATDGTGAIQVAADLRPDLILMDVQMPYMSGPSAALLLSQHFPEIKVILMSSDDSLQMRISYRSSGAQAFVFKPAFRSQFFAALDKIFGEKETLEAV